MAWIETILNGVFLGGLYGILGLGLALVFGVMRVINVAHGDFIVFAAYLGVTRGLGLDFDDIPRIVPDYVNRQG